MSNRTLKSRFRLLASLYFIFLCLTVSGFAQDEDETIKIESSLVVLNATVTDAQGKVVSRINQAKFKIYEDGIEQKIEFFEAAETPFAAVILLDTSGSMEQRVSMARSATINFLDGLRPDDAAAIYNFDSKVSLVQDFSNSRDIAPGVFDLKADGVTVLNDAILKAAQELNRRREKRKAVIILSDGADTRSKISSGSALKAALAANATIYTVDMSSADANARARMQSQGALKNFALKTGGLFVATPGGAAMREAFKSIVQELGTQYTLGYQPSNLKKDGKWRAIELKVSQPNLVIRTRKGYNSQKN